MNSQLVRLASGVLAAGLLAACGKAEDPHALDRSAAPGPARADAAPRYADQDRDGRVTREEARDDAALAASFERYDSNADGALDRGEFARLEAGASSPQPDAEQQPAPMRPREEFPRGKP